MGAVGGEGEGVDGSLVACDGCGEGDVGGGGGRCGCGWGSIVGGEYFLFFGLWSFFGIGGT